jgi:processive 1,2-diacylglycerol beta-glucosyltransferase/1,2-diacylglycerol 3-beta-galactosyltransferase
LSNQITSKYSPNQVEVFLLDGLNPNSQVQKTLIEEGYQFSTFKAPFLWPLIYQMSLIPWVMNLHTFAMVLYSTGHLRRFIRQHRITKVVNLHFLLTRPLYRALGQLKRLNIPTITIVLDPFSCHPMWFFHQFMNMIVFSKRAESEARLALFFYRKRGILPHIKKPKVLRYPPILNSRFNSPIPNEEILGLKQGLGFNPREPLYLIAGGGEGLPRGEQVLEAVLSAGLSVQIAMVCGKNRVQFEQAQHIANRHPEAKVTVYGFVDFMYQLMNCADLVITKAGPATIFECLLLSKPVLLSQRLFGQEQGNVGYVVRKGFGWFIPNPSEMVDHIRRIQANPKILRDAQERIRRSQLRNGTEEIATYIMESM